MNGQMKTGGGASCQRRPLGTGRSWLGCPFLWPTVNKAFSIACPRLLSIPSSIHDLGLLAPGRSASTSKPGGVVQAPCPCCCPPGQPLSTPKCQAYAKSCSLFSETIRRRYCYYLNSTDKDTEIWKGKKKLVLTADAHWTTPCEPQAQRSRGDMKTSQVVVWAAGT